MENKNNRPLGELFSELTRETRTLMKQEMALLRVELTEKIVQLVKDAAAIGVGAVLLFSGFLTLIAAIVLIVALFIPIWLSALLVSTLFIIIGLGLVQKGRKDLEQMKMAPEKSAQTFKETAQWAKSQMR